jgi:poly-beta-1,6-N-acetyl-D-glucosamine synthase
VIVLQTLFWVSVVFVLHCYLGYPVGIYLISRIKTKARPLQALREEDLPSITVFIPAYNEELVIAQKIENTLALEYPPERLEVMVASDGSSDRTVAIAERYRDRGVQVHHSFERCGKMGIENRLVPTARGEIVLVTDASAELSPDALRFVAAHFADPEVGCVSGSRVCLPTKSAASDGEGLYWRYESWIKQAESRLGTCMGANGQLMAVRKSLFPPIPDCNDDLYVPIHILITTGSMVRYEARAKARIPAAANLAAEWQRKVRTNVSFLRNLPYLKAGFNFRKSRIWWRLLSHHMLRRFVPFAMLVSFPLALALWNQGTPYRVIAVLQGLFYAAAAAGFVAELCGVRFKIFYVPFYFLFANSAVLLAWLRWFQRKNYSAWRTTERILPHLPSPGNITKQPESTAGPTL